MAKKADLLDEAKDLGLELTETNTIVEIEDAIASAQDAIKTAEEVSEEGDTDESEVFAKAGKRSKKVIEEEESEKERLAKKEASDEEENKKKGPAPKTRPKSERRSKKYKKAAELIKTEKIYTIDEAISLLPKLSTSSFNGSVELHIRLGVDPKHADQNIRGTVVLPGGTGVDKRIAVFAAADDAKKAKAAGAEIAGEQDLIDLLDKEEIDFDVLIATPQLMAKLSKYARILGPKGLMPNPKTGTVAVDVAKAVKEAKGGKVEYRVDKSGIIHLAVGKVDFKPEDIKSNVEVVLKAVKEAKPSSLKADYIINITIAPSMGPGIKLAF